MKKTKLSIIIPVYNEQNTLLEVLKSVYYYHLTLADKEMIIVESNSSDKSREIVQNFAKGKKDVSVVLEAKPQGKGHAVREGLKKAAGDVILIQDADLEYDVSDYPKLLKPFEDKNVNFVLGSRHSQDTGIIWSGIRKFKGKERFYAYFMNFGELILHGFFNLLYGTKIKDPTTMYKVFRKHLLKKVHLQGNYFELDWEIVCKFVRLGYIPIEIPIKYNSRGPTEGKKVNLRRDVIKWLATIISVRFKPLKSF